MRSPARLGSTTCGSGSPARSRCSSSQCVGDPSISSTGAASRRRGFVVPPPDFLQYMHQSCSPLNRRWNSSVGRRPYSAQSWTANAQRDASSLSVAWSLSTNRITWASLRANCSRIGAHRPTTFARMCGGSQVRELTPWRSTSYLRKVEEGLRRGARELR